MLRLRRAVRGGGVIIVDAHVMYQSILSETGVIPHNSLDFYFDELKNWEELRNHWQAVAREDGVNKFKDWDHRLNFSFGLIAVYYAIIRELKPSVIVETGTAAGASTVFLLAAVAKNGHGKVISIDLPSVAGELTMGRTIEKDDVGYFIPEFLKAPWDYRIGDAKALLPAVLMEEEVEVFIHDSLHTRTHMFYEYTVARALMPHGAVIASDDITMNNSFDSFLAAHMLTGYATLENQNFGVVVNAFDEFERSVGTGVIDMDKIS